MSDQENASARTAEARGARAPGRLVAAIGPILLAACAARGYESAPLEPRRVAARLVEERRAVALPAHGGDASGFDLDAAAELLRERSPDLREARAAYATAAAAAAEEEPFPNPTLELGPQFGFGPDASSPRVVPLGRLEWTLPTAGKRSERDAVRAARAESLHTGYVTRAGELYLELRRRWTVLAVARERHVVQATIEDAAARSLRAARELVDAGGADALDVSLFRLEVARERSRGLEVESELARAQADLARLLAVDSPALGGRAPGALPVLPEHGRDLEALRAHVADAHPTVLRAEAAYELADRELRLAIAKQYPDLRIGLGGEGEIGEDQYLLGVALGLALPLFDRNQVEVARTFAAREEARVGFETAVERALAGLDRAQRLAVIAEERVRVLRDEVLPAARNNVDVAHRALPAGSADALQVLDAERSLRQVELEVLEAELELYLAWSDLEGAFGAPLLDFARTGDTDAGADDDTGTTSEHRAEDE